MATLCSVVATFAPNAPPTCGATTRTRPGSIPAAADCILQKAWGICVPTKIVSSCPSPSSPGITAMALPSMGTTATRWFSNRARTTTSAPSSGSALFPPTAEVTRFVPMPSKSSGAAGSSAASGSTTAGIAS